MDGSPMPNEGTDTLRVIPTDGSIVPVPADLGLKPTLERIGTPVETVPEWLAFELEDVIHYADIDDEIHLEGAAIALDITHVQYDPDEFRGLVYYPEGSPSAYEEAEPAPAVLVFEEGRLVVPTDSGRRRARELIRAPIDRLTDLDLLSVPDRWDLAVETAPVVTR